MAQFKHRAGQVGQMIMAQFERRAGQAGQMIMAQFERHAGWLLVMAGLVMIGIGVMRGETGVVLMKAIRVCLECVGIG